MFFRFGGAIVLVVLTALAGIALQKRILDVRRAVSRQHYHMETLRSWHAKLRLETQQHGAPARVIESLERGRLMLDSPRSPVQTGPRTIPLLHWQRPTPRSHTDPGESL